MPIFTANYAVNNMYIYQRRGWPQFYWNHERITNLLATVRHKQGINHY